jgi:hypothetical protein
VDTGSGALESERENGVVVGIVGWWGGSEVGEDPDKRARGIRERGVPFRYWPGWAMCLIRYWARLVPLALFYFDLIFFFSFFYFSDLFHNFFFWNPNEFKQVSNFL